MSAAALKVQNLGKSFLIPHAPDDRDPRRECHSRRRDQFHALRDVTFSVARGETLGIIGANGSGKSTLLKILSGVMAADKGTFEAEGRIGALLELGAGFHPDLSGIENVYLNGALLGLGARDVDRILPDIIAFAELEHFMNQPVKHFSSGMISRLGFAVAANLAPDILLMDETFAAGDAKFQARALAQVAAMKRRGHTLLLVSHNMEVILTLCDRVIWIDHGKIRREGNPNETVAEYHLSQQGSMHQIHHLRAALGMESLFARVDLNAGIRLGAVRLAGGNPANGNNRIDVSFGDPVTLAVEVIPQAGRAPAAVDIETAWVRADHRIVAQGKTRVNSHRQHTTHELIWRQWPLTKGEYRLAIALTPESGPPHWDRKFEAGIVRVITPNPMELPALTRLNSHWSAD